MKQEGHALPPRRPSRLRQASPAPPTAEGAPERAARIVASLAQQASPENLAGMARYGMTVDRRFGIGIPALRALAREIGRDHALALALWDSGHAETRILASMIDDPARVTVPQANRWVRDFDSWDVCDQVCQNLFRRCDWAWERVRAWSASDAPFVRRAAFALLACLATHEKKADWQRFEDAFALIEAAATDERNFVRKAVSWALRNIGKRDAHANAAAQRCARRIAKLDSKAARWIAADTLRELEARTARRR